MTMTIDRTFVRVFNANVYALLRQPSPWAPEQVFWREAEQKLTDMMNEAAAWAFIERSMRYYAGRA